MNRERRVGYANWQLSLRALWSLVEPLSVALPTGICAAMRHGRGKKV